MCERSKPGIRQSDLNIVNSRLGSKPVLEPLNRDHQRRQYGIYENTQNQIVSHRRGLSAAGVLGTGGK